MFRRLINYGNLHFHVAVFSMHIRRRGLDWSVDLIHSNVYLLTQVVILAIKRVPVRAKFASTFSWSRGSDPCMPLMDFRASDWTYLLTALFREDRACSFVRTELGSLILHVLVVLHYIDGGVGRNLVGLVSVACTFAWTVSSIFPLVLFFIAFSIWAAWLIGWVSIFFELSVTLYESFSTQSCTFRNVSALEEMVFEYSTWLKTVVDISRRWCNSAITAGFGMTGKIRASARYFIDVFHSLFGFADGLGTLFPSLCFSSGTSEPLVESGTQFSSVTVEGYSGVVLFYVPAWPVAALRADKNSTGVGSKFCAAAANIEFGFVRFVSLRVAHCWSFD